MARRPHWTHDPRYRHLRRPPAWYQREPPLFTPRPSARMEKQAAEERRRQWQSVGSLPDDGGIHCPAAFFCPCSAYGRVSSRLRSALGGLDTVEVPAIGVCNPDCVQFCLCIPFYGCFLARLQTTIRAFYGVDGTDVNDWVDGCCCPCVLLRRADKEIVFRERQHQRLADLHTPVSSIWNQYKSQTPMTYERPGTLGPSSARAATLSPDIDKPSLSTIPEANREGMPAPVLAPSKVSTDTLSPETAADNEASSNNGKHMPLLRYLGKQWYLVPAGKKDKAKESAHNGDDGKPIDRPEPLAKTLANLGDVKTKPNDIGPSLLGPPSISRSSTLVTHGLEGEEQVYKDSSIHIHNLVDHEKTKLPDSPLLHSLEEHQKIVKTPRPLVHRLQDDRKASRSTQDSRSKEDNPATGTSTPSSKQGRHGLEDDQVMIKIPMPIAHKLDDHHAIQTVPKAVIHTLEDHAARSPSGYTVKPHRLDEDSLFSDPQESPAAHHLQDHAPIPNRPQMSSKAHRLGGDRSVSFPSQTILGSTGGSLAGSPSSKGQNLPIKALDVKRGWKPRFGRGIKLSQESKDKAQPEEKEKPKEKSKEKTKVEAKAKPSTNEKRKPEGNNTDAATDKIDPAPLTANDDKDDKATKIETHELADHAPTTMRDDTPGEGSADEQAKPVLTHTLRDHELVLMEDEPPQTPAEEEKARTKTHELRDDALMAIGGDVDESKVKEKAKHPESHLLLDDVLESQGDAANQPDKTSKST